jgi:uncharacterized protein (TIGR02996 family)
MTTEEDFLNAIKNSTNPIYERMIFADWLKENDRTEEAKLAEGSISMIPVFDNYNWMQVFGAAGGEPDCNNGNTRADKPNISSQDSKMVLVNPFSRKDVRYIHRIRDGSVNGESWVCIGQLWDGRWFTIRGGCDTIRWN